MSTYYDAEPPFSQEWAASGSSSEARAQRQAEVNRDALRAEAERPDRAEVE